MAPTSPGATPSRGRILLNSFLLSLFAGAAYLIVTLISGGFDPLWTPIGVIAVVLVLTGIFYAVNSRRSARPDGATDEPR